MKRSKAGKQGKRQKGNQQSQAGQGSMQGGTAPGEPDVERGGAPQAGNLGMEDTLEVQQSAQREGMGSHRHGNRGNEQALDATADVDDLGSRIRGAANSRADEEGR